jgi:hypothetical protein
MNCNSDAPTLYILPMEKHELDLVTSTGTMSCNVMLHYCTRHTRTLSLLIDRRGQPRVTSVVILARKIGPFTVMVRVKHHVSLVTCFLIYVRVIASTTTILDDGQRRVIATLLFATTANGVVMSTFLQMLNVRTTHNFYITRICISQRHFLSTQFKMKIP